MTDLALLERDGVTATLTLNRPEARNALSLELLAALHGQLDLLEGLAEADAPTVLTITGAGRAFCAGMDLKQIVGAGAPSAALLSSLARLCWRLRHLPMVTVARVNGAAIGGGCGLSCVCDLSVTHAEAKLGFPEVDLGLCPAVVAPWVVRKCGAGRARAILLRGGVMSGSEAHDAGLVDALAPDAASLDETCGGLVGRLAAGGASALRATKSLLNQLDGSDDASLGERGAAISARIVASPEAQAALRARLG
ncbi:MAG: enoyl-CoA hydratase/isomerase family protein [Phycisphaerales bacterium JB039]